MLHKIIGGGNIVTPFLRFTTDSGANLDPVFTAATATFEWINPDGSISTGTTPNPALDQTGAYTVKCSDWSNVTALRFQDDHVTILDNLPLCTSLTMLRCYTNSISILDVSTLTSLTEISCENNTISILDVSALTSLTALYCENNGMNETNVDKILADLVIAGVSSGTCWIHGTNAAPSVAGEASKTTLEGRGWAVTTS